MKNSIKMNFNEDICILSHTGLSILGIASACAATDAFFSQRLEVKSKQCQGTGATRTEIRRTSGLPGAINYLLVIYGGKPPHPLISDLNKQVLWFVNQ